jgi:hypothetical protein
MDDTPMTAAASTPTPAAASAPSGAAAASVTALQAENAQLRASLEAALAELKAVRSALATTRAPH